MRGRSNSRLWHVIEFDFLYLPRVNARTSRAVYPQLTRHEVWLRVLCPSWRPRAHTWTSESLQATLVCVRPFCFNGTVGTILVEAKTFLPNRL